MIISPPFIREQNASDSDYTWINRMLPIDARRSFPLNAHGSWHGGVHVTHSDATSRPEMLRAIADGVVVSFRKPSGLEKRDAFPLNYNGKTDDGYVLLKHETAIGSGDSGSIVFYSLYMHLQNRLDPAIVKGAKIWRKDVIGQSGMVDGANAFHFQVFCDDENMMKLTGRTTPGLNIAADGRTDTIYGDIHFYLPTGTVFYEQIPNMASPDTSQLKTVHTSTEPLYVSMTFEKGDCMMITRRQKATSNTLYDLVGDPLVSVDHKKYEYALYNLAKQLYPQSRSAGFELLRFGRVISADVALTPTNAPLWRTVTFPGGTGMVNLAVPEIKKFSDADFPHWTGWWMVDDDTDNNSQCNSLFVESLQKDGDFSAISSRLVCRFPLEWNAATFDQRYSWLKSGNDNIPAMQDEDYEKIKTHASALCFDPGALGSGYFWHFHPAEFISHFRKCGWLSQQELKQIVPMHAIRNAGKVKGMVWESIPWHDGEKSLAERINIPLNRAMQKYLITTPLRTACFLGNAIQETQWLTRTEEGGSTHLWYYPWHGRGLLQLTNPINYFTYFTFCGKSYPETVSQNLMTEYRRLSNLPGDLRHKNSKLPDTDHPDLPANVIEWRNYVASSDETVADSAGFYWALNPMAFYADEEHSLERCSVSAGMQTRVYYRSPAFWKACATVNLPGKRDDQYSHALNGFEARCCVYGNAISVLTEMKFPDANQKTVNDKPESNQLRRVK
ncbi:M23 family metallopeptidase [Franconibacter pulveris 1160]|uniref:M23 family metallopeptidase n=1 Tax=Franconibacter pulveris TaxID=435910 RepID=UPI00046320F2|nr:M23 family metallopeptidase [Franconibacter pulveris]